MNRRVKKKWLKNLRSREYAQTDGNLCTEGIEYDSFCCLGVLCDLYLREKGEGWEELGDKDGQLYIKVRSGSLRKDMFESCFLPEQVQIWAGLTSCDPSTSEGSLSEMNDAGESFKYIANIIEKEL